jgi:hypothetical protein
MNETSYPRCLVWAWIAWAVVLALVIAAWVVMLFDGDDWAVGFLLGGSGCAMSAVAATLHVRSFAVRVCSLIRAASVRELEDSGLRPVG